MFLMSHSISQEYIAFGNAKNTVCKFSNVANLCSSFQCKHSVRNHWKVFRLSRLRFGLHCDVRNISDGCKV